MIYLDNAATSYPKPESVYTTLENFLRRAGGNPGRANHQLSLEAEQVMFDVRIKIARLIKASSPKQIVFTLNCTDALNIAIKGIAREGDHFITSQLEHNSVIRPLANLKNTRRIETTSISFDSKGCIDPNDIKRAINSKTRAIIISHASNVLGTIHSILEIGKIARDHDLLFLVDAAQTIGRIPIDIENSYIDLLAAPGHKGLMGPPGTGFLYVGERASLLPWREGGTGENSLLEHQPTELPYFLEAGTPNTVGIAALGTAIEYINKEGIEQLHEHEVRLIEELSIGLEELSQISVYKAPLNQTVGVLSFTMEMFDSHEAATLLDQPYNIAVRSGLHCSPHTHKNLGTIPNGTIRVSPGIFNSSDDIDQLLSALKDLIKG